MYGITKSPLYGVDFSIGYRFGDGRYRGQDTDIFTVEWLTGYGYWYIDGIGGVRILTPAKIRGIFTITKHLGFGFGTGLALTNNSAAVVTSVSDFFVIIRF